MLLQKHPLRVLILNPEYPPLGGGAANATYYLLKQFTKQKKLHIDLVTSSTDKFKIEKLSPNITVHYLNIGKRNRNLHHQSNLELLAYTFFAYRYARKLTRATQYHLTHAFFGIPSGLIAMLLKRPYIISLRGSDVPGYNPRFALADKLVFQHISRLIWQKAQSVIANSQGLKDLALLTSSTQPISIIPNGIDTSEFSPSRTQPTYPPLKLLTVSRLTKRKSINLLIQACSDLPFSNWQLSIAGTGQEETNLKSLTQKLQLTSQVTFLGNVPHDKLPTIYNSYHLFILPSQNEGMSNTILEAMASGLPIITTNTGGSYELIKNNGIIIPSPSVENIKKAILKYNNNPSLISEHSDASRKISKKFKWETIAKKYFQYYLSNSL